MAQLSKKQEWSCTACTLINISKYDRCTVCDKPRYNDNWSTKRNNHQKKQRTKKKKNPRNNDNKSQENQSSEMQQLQKMNYVKNAKHGLSKPHPPQQQSQQRLQQRQKSQQPQQYQHPQQLEEHNNEDEKKNEASFVADYAVQYKQAVAAYKQLMQVQSAVIKTMMIKEVKVAVVSAMALAAWHQLSIKQQRYLIAEKMVQQMTKMKIGSHDHEKWKLSLKILKSISIYKAFSMLKDEQKLKEYIKKISGDQHTLI